MLFQGNPALCKDDLQHSSNKVTQFFNSCYEFVHNSQRMWSLADIYCKYHGGQLLSIESVVEEEYIYEVLRQTYGGMDSVWIGLSDLKEEGVFRWSNGKIL